MCLLPFAGVFVHLPGMTDNEYAVLTTYVPDFDQLHVNLNGRNEVSEQESKRRRTG